MHDLILALRNAGRNRRRSLVTILALALCSAGLILFAGYVSATFRADETRTVATLAHLQIFQKGFPEKGIGNPAAFHIEDHEELKRVLEGDAVLGPMLRVVTGQLVFAGLVSHYENDASAGFMGVGVFPGDHEVISGWNPHRIVRPTQIPSNELLYEAIPEVDDADPTGGTLAIGLAEVLGIGPSAESEDDAVAAVPAPPADAGPGDVADDDLPNFAVLEAVAAETRPAASDRPSVELLCAPSAGAAPNVQTLAVRSVRNGGNVQLDERLIVLHIRHASALLFPGEPIHVTTLRLLLNRTDEVDAAAARVRELLAERRPDLECRTWVELSPFFRSITIFLRVLFVFMFGIIATIVLFTIYNTLAAAIVERTSEIGTLRAMGLDRGRVARLFVLEGLVMGILGGLLGVLLAVGIGALINGSEVLFVAPTTSYYMKVEVLILRNPIVLLYGFVTAVVTAVVSAIVPAVHAGRMPIVDALRHV